jgi:hypothetical protein
MQKQFFKESQLFSWDSEPVDERPSEFMHSKGYATLSGHDSSFDAQRPAPQRGSHFGLPSVLLFALTSIAVGGWAIIQIASMLRH